MALLQSYGSGVAESYQIGAMRGSVYSHRCDGYVKQGWNVILLLVDVLKKEWVIIAKIRIKE